MDRLSRVKVRADLRRLDGYHSPQVDVAVRLNTNESPFGPPDAWRREFVTALGDVAWNRYPDRMASELRAAIGRLHGVDREQVFAANGSNEVLQTLILTFAGPGRTVVLFEPTYQMHAQIARTVGSAVVSGRRRADFTLDPDDVRRTIADADPAIVFLCSPNNPTGLVEPADLVEMVIESSPGLVVVDEAYAQFAASTSLDLIGDDVPLVVTRTFSKTWSMAATRLGYAVGPRSLVAKLDEVVLPYHLDTAKQLAGTLALRYTHEMDGRVAEVVAERDRVSAGLTRLDVDVVPSGANFVLFRPRSADGPELWQALVERGVLVRDCSAWPGLASCLRVTIGTADENDRFLMALADALGTSAADELGTACDVPGSAASAADGPASTGSDVTAEVVR